MNVHPEIQRTRRHYLFRIANTICALIFSLSLGFILYWLTNDPIWFGVGVVMTCVFIAYLVSARVRQFIGPETPQDVFHLHKEVIIRRCKNDACLHLNLTIEQTQNLNYRFALIPTLNVWLARIDGFEAIDKDDRYPITLIAKYMHDEENFIPYIDRWQPHYEGDPLDKINDKWKTL